MASSPPVPAALVQQHMTAVAQAAMGVSEQLAASFGGLTLGRDPALRFKVGRPDGPSSEGGKRARLPLSLSPVDAPGGSGVMLGWVDVAASEAQLRAYHVAREQWRARFGGELSVAQPEYDRLLAQLSQLLRSRGMRVLVSEAAPPARSTLADTPEPQPTRAPLWPWAVGFAGGVLTTLLIVRFLL